RLDHAGRGARARAISSAASAPPARCHSEGTHARGTAQTDPAPGEGTADEARTWNAHQGAHGRVRPVEGDGVSLSRRGFPVSMLKERTMRYTMAVTSCVLSRMVRHRPYTARQYNRRSYATILAAASAFWPGRLLEARAPSGTL